MPGSLPPLQAVPDPTALQNFDAIQRAWPAEPTYAGSGSPNTVVSAGPGALYRDLSTGTIWVHTATTVSNTGWLALRSGSIAATITGTSVLPGNATLGVNQKVTCNTVVTDTAGWWNTGTARYVPQLPGRYRTDAWFQGTAAGAAGALIWDLSISKSGTLVAIDRRTASTSYGPDLTISYPVRDMNGTTDYLELWGGQTATATSMTGTQVFHIVYEGPA